MNLRSIFLLSAAALCASTVSTGGLAAEPGPKLSEKGHLVIGAERMFGVTATSLTSESTTGGATSKSTNSQTNLSLLWSYPTTVHNVPRLGFDYLVIPHLSLGLSAGLFSNTSKRDNESTNGGISVSEAKDGPSISTWLVAPRLGYVLDLGDTVSLWLRGGLTFYGTKTTSEDVNGSVTRTTTMKQSGSAFALEPTFVVTPVPHFGFYGALALDLPLGGKNEVETVTKNGSFSTTASGKTDYTQSSFGAVFGLLGYL